MLEAAPGHVNRVFVLALFCCLIRTSLSRALVVCCLLVVTFVYVEAGMCHPHAEAGEQLAGIAFLLKPMGPRIDLRSTGSAASALSHWSILSRTIVSLERQMKNWSGEKGPLWGSVGHRLTSIFITQRLTLYNCVVKAGLLLYDQWVNDSFLVLNPGLCTC